MNAPIDDKIWSTLLARAALAGISLRCIDDDRGKPVYVATRVDWCVTRQLDDVDALRAFLTRAEAVRA